MDPLCMCLALGPAAIYLLLLGAINLSRRPLLVSGGRDAAALGLAVGGLMLIGPFALLLPEGAAARFGPHVWLFWLLVLGCYAVGLLLVILLLKPRLVIYNISADQLRPILAELVERLDGDARWAGDSLLLPNLGVQLHVDSFAALRNVSLGAVGTNQNYLGWRRLEAALGAALSGVEVARNLGGLSLLGAGVSILAALVVVIALDPQAVAQTLREVLEMWKR